MRLIDADAEIAKIEQEIEKHETRIIWLQNKKSEEPENNYNDWDEKIERCERNILDCRKEIRMLRSYSTAYDPDKVVEQITDLTAETFRIVDKSLYIPAKEAIEIVKGGGME